MPVHCGPRTLNPFLSLGMISNSRLNGNCRCYIKSGEMAAAMFTSEAGTEISEPPAKRQKKEQPADHLAVALRKLATHIGEPKKFHKASELLLQLLHQHGAALDKSHAPLLFEALKAALRDPSEAEIPENRKAYLRLVTAASKLAHIFGSREKAQLDVYGIWAVLRNQLHTDDSFVFNRVVGRIKESVSHLPEATPEDDGALQDIKARLPEPVSLPPADRPAEEGDQADADPEADPFGLDALIDPKPQRKPDPPKSTCWSSREILGMKREALLDCYRSMQKEIYSNLWARTSVDLAVEELVQQRSHFCSSQQADIDQLKAFVDGQRLKRRKGAVGSGAKLDETAFEAARAQWGRATISARGMVGAGGDHKSEAWLG